MCKRLIAFLAASAFGLAAPLADALADQPAPWHIGLQVPATPVMERVASFHELLVWVITFICIIVLALLAYACWRFRETSSPKPSRRSHNTLLEVVWTAVPVLVLVIVAVPSFKLLYYADVLPETELTVKAVGNQWYWSYVYPDDDGFEFVSNMVADEDLQPGQPRLLQTDNIVVVPVDTNVRIQVTATDVLHSWAMPAFGMKIDAIPGRLNEGWFRVERPGTYYGQCSELCGVNHGFMPITVQAVPKDEFKTWVEKAKVEFAVRDTNTPTQVALRATTPDAR